jgi:hypothetical protein
MTNDVLEPAAPRPPIEATVPKALVHKRAIEQVLLSGAARVSDGEFVVSSQPPRAHRYFSDSLVARYDSLLLLEISRQAGVLVAHEFLGVPLDHQFVFSGLTMEVHDADALAAGPRPAELVARCRLLDSRRQRDRLTRTTLEVAMELDGRLAATVIGGAAYLPAHKYRSLRRLMGSPVDADSRLHPAQRVVPEAVGRCEPQNVVIAAPVCAERVPGVGSTLSADVVVDERHPTFFDHPLDHLPGTLLMEAFRQCAVVAAHRVHGLDPATALLRDCRVEYSRFAELGPGVICDAVVGPRGDDGGPTVPVDLSLVQLGTGIAHARLTLTDWRQS